jgi:hypothetical protein
MSEKSAAPMNVPTQSPITSATGGNPIHGIRCVKPTSTPPPLTKPPRILSSFEIKTVWEVLSLAPSDDAYKRTLKLILVSGQGSNAVAGMHSEEISGKCWTVPDNRSWDRRSYQVFLTASALELIGHTKGYIFILGGNQPIASQNLARFLSSRKIAYCGLDKWTPRDLRATVMHYMTTLGISINAREAIFGTTITGSYGGGARIHEYDATVITAMQKWEAELLRIVGHDQTSLGIPIAPVHPVFGL